MLLNPRYALLRHALLRKVRGVGGALKGMRKEEEYLLMMKEPEKRKQKEQRKVSAWRDVKERKLSNG